MLLLLELPERLRRLQMQQTMMTNPMKRARAMPTMRGMGAWSSTSIGVGDLLGPGQPEERERGKFFNIYIYKNHVSN